MTCAPFEPRPRARRLALALALAAALGSCTDRDSPTIAALTAPLLLSGAGVTERGVKLSYLDGSHAEIEALGYECHDPAQGCTAGLGVLPDLTADLACRLPAHDGSVRLQIVCDLAAPHGAGGALTLGSDGAFRAELSSGPVTLVLDGATELGSVRGRWTLRSSGGCVCEQSGSFEARRRR